MPANASWGQRCRAATESAFCSDVSNLEFDLRRRIGGGSPLPEDLVPPWAREPVEIVDYDPAWAADGARECDQLQVLLGTWLTNNIEHVGSTAVPGLAAKPILDLQAPVDSLDVADAIAEILVPHRWHYVPPHLDRRHDRRFFIKVVDGRRAAHLHLLVADTARWHQQVAFRDALRTHPDLVHSYVELKALLAEKHRHDREAYSARKQQFINDVLTRGQCGN